jgi:YD repeat-containing protein
MKNAFFPCLLTLALFTSCEKDNDPPVNPDEVRLTGVDAKNNNGDVWQTRLEYDASGKISRATIQRNNGPVSASYNISYSSNEVVLAAQPYNDASLTNTDTIRLLLDANGRLVRRTQYTFLEFKAPVNNPQRTFIYDTIHYEYDAAGLLNKKIHGNTDSTWFNPPFSLSTTNIRTTGVSNYNNQNGNVVSVDEKDTMRSVNRQNNQVFLNTETTETNTLFEYSRAFPNKTDFTNAVILNELNLFGSPLNRNYRNLPELISSSTIKKSANGTVISNDQSAINQQFTYNAYGFVATKTTPGVANEGSTYIYNK